MENYNFLPETYYQMRRIKKLKKYKIVIFMLWLISLSVFIAYEFNLNRYKIIYKDIKSNSNSKVDKISKAPKEVQNDSITLSAFKYFYEDIDGKLPYNTAVINNKEINLELVIRESEQYYTIVEKFDNMSSYKIVYVSPLSYDNDTYKFRLILEVRL